ncbi:DUF2239 family protein [Xylophilus sp. Leaf220]|uniref:DUF2239 family protein n=1 Tax=Xylophilus sp. Leaf220 TaxID=1735686 RepID=UPI0009EC4FB2|nr:DUF2239 family protein [Xylophilus sp. Leaf220]
MPAVPPTAPFSAPDPSPHHIDHCTAFVGTLLVASGNRASVAEALKHVAGPFMVFDDRTGRCLDLDSVEDLAPQPEPADSSSKETVCAPPPRPRGRPRLGVVAREVTLLPEHWEWLSRQPGGASVAIRRLVVEARQSYAQEDGARAGQEVAYRFVSAIAGNLPGYEDALRALFVGDRKRFDMSTSAWPEDVRDYARARASGAWAEALTP